MDIDAALVFYGVMRAQPIISFIAVAALAAASQPALSQEEGNARSRQFRIESLEPQPEAQTPAAPKPQSKSSDPADIEAESGGRLGIALVDARGKLLLGFNRDDRFAMCSTFKAPLAAAILSASDKGRFGLEGNLPVSESDVLAYAPVVKANLKKGRMSIEELTKAAVEVSDNSAANILLPLIGGPPGLTSFFRVHGDDVTRLDRTEPSLNENAARDPRDTTSPAAMAGLMSRLLFKDLAPASADRLRGWLEDSKTGDNRIRAGLPRGWKAGDKTGTCGNAYNDVAVVRSPKGRDYVLAIYLDRPGVSAERSEATIARAARAALDMLADMESGSSR